jgi:lipoprotein-anchoring transpeptidase ErfK/SrfK
VTRAAVLAAVCGAALALAGCASAVTSVGAPAPQASTAVAAATDSPPPTPIPTPIPPQSPTPAPNECAANTVAQLVLVSISQQLAWLCNGQTTTLTTPVTTGATADGWDDTPTGTFHILARETNRTLTLLSGAKYHVSYWLPFQGNLYGFHDAAWQTMPFGSQDYHTLGSHGCVHLPMDAMAFLYNWVAVGATVTVRS